jgi:hypothetical protein
MPKAQPLLLDLYPNAAVAYSLRKLRSGYKQSYNLWSYSEELQQSVWTKTNLTVTADTIVAPDGNTTGDVLFETAITGLHQITRSASVVVGNNYNFSFYFQPINGREFIRVTFGTQLNSALCFIDMSNGNITLNTGFNSISVTSVSGGWYLVDMNITATGTSTPNMVVSLSQTAFTGGVTYLGDVTKGVSIWGLQVTQSTTILPYEKTVVAPSNGNAIRVRRTSDNTDQDFGFDSSGNLDVNSIENFVGYNLFAWSEELQQTYWNKTNLDVTTNTLVAPDGLTTGDILFETVTSGTHVMGRTLAVTAGSEYTVSFWVQPQGRTFIRVATAVNLSWDGTTIPVAWINLSTGTIISQSAGYGGTFQITTAPNGWFLINYTVRAVNNATSQTIELNLSTNGSQIAYVGNPTLGVAVWGLQVTQSSTLRPYRKTLAVAEGQGFITTWYDQSGNGNNATQLTPSSQAQIVINGNIIIDTTTLKPTTTWTADSYGLINGVNPNTRYLSVSVNTRLTINDEILHLGTTNNPGSVNGQQSLRWRGGDGLIQSFRHTQSSHGLITTNGSYIIMSEKDSNNLKSVSINGFVNSSGTEVPANGTFMNQFGRSSAVAATTAQYQEFIYWDSEQSANRANIETLINDYYAIY